MIKYALVCEKGHDFEAWFSGSDDFDSQKKRGFVTCAHCGSQDISKALMTPGVSGTKKSGDAIPVASMDAMHSQMVEKLRAMKKEIEKSGEDVGEKFPEEARKIHYGETEARGIYGKASLEEAASLAEEGVEFMPIPELPEEKN